MVMIASSVRDGIAGYVSSLFLVYSILILAWVVGSWVIATGRVPGWMFPILRFLESVVGPYMALFRRFIPPIGPVDISPLVGLILLQVVGSVLVSLIRG